MKQTASIFNMKQIILGIFAALFCFSANAQKHTPVEIRQLAYRKLPNGQKPLGLDLDKYLASYLVKNGGGGGGTVPDTVLSQAIYESLTYAALTTNIADSTLTVGKRYLISDYKTVFNLNISGTAYTDATVEPIVVTALTTYSLEPIAFSPAYPKDILYYSVDGSTYMPGSTKGCITRRIDTEKNISVPFDFREFKVEVGTWETMALYDNATTYPRGKILKDESDRMYISLVDGNLDNTPADGSFWAKISDSWTMPCFNNISILGNSINYGASLTVSNPFTVAGTTNFEILNDRDASPIFYINGNVANCKIEWINKSVINSNVFDCEISTLIDVIHIGDQFFKNKLSSTYSCIFANQFTNNYCDDNGQDGDYGMFNSVLMGCNYNKIRGGFGSNIIKDGFRDNTIGLRFQNNTIGTNFGGLADNYGNQIGNDFHDNVIGNYFSGNVIGNWFYGNTVGNDCQENILPFKFYSNITGDSFQNWHGQHYLNGVDFTLLTLPVSGATKYIFYDPTDFNSWGYYDNGVFTVTPF